MWESSEEQVGESDEAGRERRLTLRAYTHWGETARGRAMPALGDFDSQGLAPFRDSSFLIGFEDEDYLQPVYRFVGEAVLEMTGPVPKGSPVRGTAPGTILDRIADHYLEAVAHKAPVGFDAEYEREDGSEVLYRGILLPLGETGETVDLLMGVLSWKVVAPDEARPPADPPDMAASPAPSGAAVEGLQALLADCRTAAEEVTAHEQRSHRALYRALARIYRFVHAAESEPEAYRALLRQAGLREQRRAPLTPAIKLVFGGDYDKARITEYAAALSHLQRRGVTPETAEAFLSGYEGGLKAMVAAERAVRRAERGEDPEERNRSARRRIAALAPLEIARKGVVVPGETEYVLLLARRRDAQLVEPVAALPEDGRRLDSLLRRAAACADEDAEGGAGEPDIAEAEPAES